MTPGVAFGVVAHRARRAAALDLADRLGAYLSVDDGTLGGAANHRHVWEVLVDAPARWVCVLEDDAVPVAGFAEQLEAALAVAPSPVVSLYLGTSRPPRVQVRIENALRRADQSGACWITATAMLHAVGVCLRTDLVADMLTCTRTAAARTPADERFTPWLRRRRLCVAHTVPSLVEHADWPTTIDHHADGQPRTEPRRAWRAGSRVRWTGLTVRL